MVKVRVDGWRSQPSAFSDQLPPKLLASAREITVKESEEDWKDRRKARFYDTKDRNL